MTGLAVLRVAAVLATAADFGTYALAPELEANPVFAGRPVVLVLAVKVAALTAVLALSASPIAVRRPAAVAGLLAVVIAVGAFGLGANLATIAAVGLVR